MSESILQCAGCGGTTLYNSGVGTWPVRQSGNERRVELLVPFKCVACPTETSVVFHSTDKGGYDKLTVTTEATNGRESIYAASRVS